MRKVLKNDGTDTHGGDDYMHVNTTYIQFT